MEVGLDVAVVDTKTAVDVVVATAVAATIFRDSLKVKVEARVEANTS